MQGHISLAQIIRDGTVGPAVGSVVEPTGPNFQIDSTLGRIEGSNLFHSFQDFNVQTLPDGTVESAMFTNSLPAPIQNILSRVTGGNASTINGTLASTIEDAALFLLNPNGVVFGPNSSLDLKGSFHVSTADVLRFDNGQAFYMDASIDGSMDSVLKMPALSAFGFADAPSTFGFASDVPAPITIEQAVLQVSDTETVSVVGGDVTIRGAEVRAGPKGHVTLAGVGSHDAFNSLTSSIEVGMGNGHGTVNLAEGTIVVGGAVQVVAQGDIGVGQDSRVTNGGGQGGLIHVESQSGTTLVAGTLEANNTTGQGGTVHLLGDRVGLNEHAIVDVSGELGGGTALIGGDYKGEGTVKNATRTYVGPQATIRADAQIAGDGGRVIVWADEATRFEGIISATGGSNAGDGGFAEVSGKQKLVYVGHADLGTSRGESGTLLLDPQNLIIADGGDDDLVGVNNTNAQIFEFEESDDAGSDLTSRIDADAVTGALLIADVELQATHAIRVDEPIEHEIAANTLTFRARDMTLSERIRLPEGHIKFVGLSPEQELSNLDLEASTISLDNTGIVAVAAPDDNGVSAKIIGHQSVHIFNESRIFGRAGGLGLGFGGGDFVIDTPLLTIEDSILLASTSSDGIAGDFVFKVESFTMVDSLVDGSAGVVESSGNIVIHNQGGSEVPADSVTMVQSTFNVQDLAGGAKGDALATLAPGKISIRTKALRLEKESSINTEGLGKPGGAIDLHVDSLEVLDGSRISANGESDTSREGVINVAGTININSATDPELPSKRIGISGKRISSILLDDGSSSNLEMSSGIFSSGIQGMVNLLAETVMLEDDGTISTQTGIGAAGSINIEADQVDLRSGAQITSSATGGGMGGTITINAREITLDGTDTIITADTMASSPVPFADLGVELDIVHPENGDLIVTLRSPDGDQVGILGKLDGFDSSFGPGEQNLTKTRLDDRASPPVLRLRSEAPFTGTFLPEEPLASLIGKPLNGTWTLEVADKRIGNEGQLSAWSLDFGNGIVMSTDVPIAITDGNTSTSTLQVKSEPGALVQEAAPINHGGDILLSAETIDVRNGARVTANTSGTGKGGSIALTAVDNVTITGTDSGLFTTAAASGDGGNITVNAGAVTFSDKAKASATSAGSSNAGTIDLNGADLVLLQGGSSISSTNSGKQGLAGDITIGGVEGSGLMKTENGTPIPLVNTIRIEDSTLSTDSNSTTGGNITLRADFLIHLIDSQIRSEIANGTSGGNINLDPQFIILQGIPPVGSPTNAILSARAAQVGNGGEITLGNAETISFVDQSRPRSQVIDVRAGGGGIAGVVNDSGTTANLSEEVPRPDVAIIDPQSFLPVRCASQQGGSFSSIVEAGLDVLPPEPGDFFPSPLPFFDDAEGSRSTSQSSISIEPHHFGFSTTQEGSDVSNQIVLSSLLLGCSL